MMRCAGRTGHERGADALSRGVTLPLALRRRRAGGAAARAGGGASIRLPLVPARACPPPIRLAARRRAAPLRPVTRSAGPGVYRYWAQRGRAGGARVAAQAAQAGAARAEYAALAATGVCRPHPPCSA